MDELLVKRAKKGDKESYTKAVLQVKDQAYKVAYCYLHNEEDSMDAVCDAVEKAYKNIKNLRDCQHFNTWFIRIVINECKIQLRSKHNTVDIEEQTELRAINKVKPGKESLGRKILAVCAILCFVFVGAVKISPEFAAYASNVPGLENAVEWLQKDKGIINAQEHGYTAMEPIIREEDGYVLHLDNIFLDEDRIRLSAQVNKTIYNLSFKRHMFRQKKTGGNK